MSASPSIDGHSHDQPLDQRGDRRLQVCWLMVAMVFGSATAAVAAGTAVDQCLACHRQLDGAAAEAARLFADDVHKARGFSCADCHGGDPSTDDIVQAKDPARGFIGRPDRQKIIQLCARCHSDATFMRRYAPAQRVDQANEYATSVHGQRLARGDRHVATCASCHGAHGIREIRDPRSAAYPLNVASTCARCHSNRQIMGSYTQADGSPLPTDQRDHYQKSVHYRALTVGNDLSAPTCNDCHGNHGAVPPGAGTVGNVCGTCHAAFAARFQATKHQQVLERGCVECHGNHAVASPRDEMLGTAPPAVCVGCHTPGDSGLAAAAAMRNAIDRLRVAAQSAETDVAALRNAGMQMNAEEVALREARSQLMLARTEVHTFDATPVRKAAADGTATVTRVRTTIDSARAELRFRRWGLGASLGAILLVVLALSLKIREVDRLAGLRDG
jgi:predicted CXXCH cytochrome family protein